MMKNFGLVFLAILSVLLVSCGQELNLDRRPDFDELNFRELNIPYADEQKIITRVKDVSVKSVPFPFNGGIIKNSKNDWVLFFREQLGENSNRIGFVALNEDFEFKEGPFYLKGDPTLEDPRIVQSFLGRIALVANKADSSNSHRQIVVIDGQEGPSGLPSFTAEKIIVSSKTEKNWSPFFWEEELFFSYGIENSHAVLSEKKICSQQRCFFNGEFSYKTTSTEWAWGKMRGGTPAQFLKIDGFEPGYLSFFHSVYKRDGLVYYFIGALVFEAVPPFKIKKISKEPIISKGMFSCAKEVPHLRNNWIVSYPTGLAVERNQAIVSIGVNDSCMKIVSIDLNNLLSSMRSVP